MKDTVVIVGTHPSTRAKAPFRDENKDIWVFNNQLSQEWCTRANAIFDMHPPADISRRRSEHPAFNDWMKAAHGIPFYTPEPVEDCPDNVVFPLDEVMADILPNFKRLGGKVNQYFTSGPAYALALAIHMGYKRIEMFGIEMESNSEYIYQRDGIGLYFGIALGRGIEVVIPDESVMFYAPLYGYSHTAEKIDREAFEQRATELAQVMEKTFEAFNKSKGRLDEVTRNMIAEQQSGATQEQLQAMGKVFEQAQQDYEQCLANHAHVNGQYVDCRMWQSRVEKAAEFSGQAQEILAQNDEKWQRVADRVTLTQKGTGLPGNEPTT